MAEMRYRHGGEILMSGNLWRMLTCPSGKAVRGQ